MTEPRIAVLTPVYNESKCLSLMLSSVVNQDLVPAKILIADNESTDGSPELARRILDESGISYGITKVPRIPELGKENLQQAYYSLCELLRSDKKKYDYIATIEADVVIERQYFKEIIDQFQEDPTLGISAGTLEPLGLLRDPYPFTGSSWNLWGANRLYKARCWFEVNDLVDFRCIPAWDTDHVILARLRGYNIYPVPFAKSQHLRALRPRKGRMKGRTDRRHGLPIWWVALKTIQNRDMDYFLGYLGTPKQALRPECHDRYLEAIRDVYRYGATRLAVDALLSWAH